MTKYNSRLPVSLGFEPCTGDQYYEGFTSGCKLLVLGESHYEKRRLTVEEHRQYTCVQFSDYHSADYKEDTGRLGGQLNRILTGDRNPSKEKVSGLWRKLAFSNFVQQMLLPNGRPTSDQWRESNRVFPDLLAYLKPDIVLVLGRGTWNNIHLGEAEKPAGESFLDRHCDRPLYRFDYADGHAYATWVYHPSRPREDFAAAHDVFDWLVRRAVRLKDSHLSESL